MRSLGGAEQLFSNYIEERNLTGTRLGAVLGAVLVPSGLLLDYFTTEFFAYFTVVRLLASVGCLAILAATFTAWAKRWPFILAMSPVLVCAVGFEAMIVRLGGYDSFYYAALMQLMLAVGVLYYFRLAQVILLCSLILLIWVLGPPLAGLPWEQGASVFFTNLYALTIGAVIAIAANAGRYAAVRREQAAKYKLADTSAELAAALERAQEVDRLKNEFFANVSHELRTPLTLILSPVDDLLRTLEAGPMRDALKVVRKNAGRLMRLIDDLLDLAKLEAGGLRLRVARLDITNLALGVFENFQPAAKTNGVTLCFDDAGGPLEPIYGDSHRVEIILTNLVGNAMKFTPPGGQIGIRIEPSSSGVEIHVSDTGPGISVQEQARIFERFHQTESSARRRQGGVGIGLALARELAELHGGELTVESTLGRGSTFTLKLRAGQEHFRQDVKERRSVRVANHPGRRTEDQVPNTAKVALGPLPVDTERTSERILLDRGRLPRVLVVEDEEDLRGFIAGVLRRAHEVETAKDGAEALEALKKNRPDLVLSDVMMPGTSGLDLCRSIKADPGLQHIPVILLTARGESEAALEGYAAGADDFVSKPFHTKVLLARVRAHLKVRALSLQLADQARLVSAGTLAAGMAHEIKNPLNAMKNAAYVLKQGGSGRVSNETLMNLIVEAIERIDGVVSALGEHARPADGNDLRACNVQQGMEATLELLAHKLEGIAVHCDLADVAEVCAPARAFNQVLLNLVDNAARSGAKNIWLELQQTDGRVTVAVSDDGPGVPAELVSRLFDPFFTTRKEGEGTGLGLHLSRRIAEGCGGALRYEARAGGGARFVMEVPAMGRAA